MNPTGTTTEPTTMSSHAERKLAKEVNEEYHDPYDDWGARDILLSLIPFIVVFMFRDAALTAGLAFAIAWAGGLLILRIVFFDGWRKLIWPVIDITSLILFAVLRGVTRKSDYHMYKWIPVIVPLTYVVVAIISLLWRRPFSAHYARFPKFDKGGKGLFHGDAEFRRTSDITTIGWISVWSVSLLLSLIPILTGYWAGWNALNIIFNYIVPIILLISGIVFQQLMGSWYRKHAGAATASTVTGTHDQTRGVGYPSGVPTTTGTGTTGTGTTGQPTTYSSAV